MAQHQRRTHSILLGASALVGALTLLCSPAAAQQQTYTFELPAQPLDAALRAFASQSQQQVIFTDKDTVGRRAPSLNGEYSVDDALGVLLAGTDLQVHRTSKGVLTIASASDPQSGSAAGDGADQGTVAALIVTAQKREEQIQDVPIAISAFTEKSLQEQKIEGGFDLLKAIPNVTFSKNNFTSYNFSIRGIGTKAVSATTDPGVAVSFNNIALLQNRLFEQEYFDVERVEVLRGPQGTLYGRNATAGVINVISAKPNLHEFSGWLKGEVGNYHSKRVSAMVNVPLIEDKLAVRFAGALTDRQGYDYNSVTKNHVNGRDLWSGRLTIGFNPTDNIRSNLIWERFNEDDNRSRTGKQLCHRDPGPSKIGNTTTDGSTFIMEGYPASGFWYEHPGLLPSLFSQGCLPGSLYNDSAFGTPNGLALPFVFAMGVLGESLWNLGQDSQGNYRTLINITDPYGGMMQSPDLRTIASFRDPRYRAKADVVELNLDVDVSPHLHFASQTAYDKDSVYSFQDFNRFNTLPIFTDTAQLTPGPYGDYTKLAAGGIFCDPQLGCSNTLAGFDISQAKSTQFAQEVRLQSDFDGPVNFSVGANYTKFNVLVDYYVFYNLITAFAMMPPFNETLDVNLTELTTCAFGNDFRNLFGIGFTPPGPSDAPDSACPYIDPNPIESINGQGHNYFRSKNPYRLKSGAAFGEVYWQATPALKVTAGLRYTDDRKVFTPVPSQILLSPGLLTGGTVAIGYPELAPIKQHWGEWTGRLGVDWKPDLSFTDQTMVYAFYSRGYKGGGANPPQPGFATEDQIAAQMLAHGYSQDTVDFVKSAHFIPVLKLTAAEYEPTFRPEFVNAFEVGAKNTLLGGGLTLNADAFFYDYTDYQVSQIRDRTAVNENFDAKVWGLEFQGVFAPSRDFQVIGNLGYLDTEIGKGMKSIDIMNRTQSNPNYVLVKPWVQLPSNCVVPLHVAEDYLKDPTSGGYYNLCGGVAGLLKIFGANPPLDSAFGNTPYDVSNYPELNGGAGLYDSLAGNELPNSPHWTANIGAQYGFDLADGWRATLRGDAYWQSQSWARVYNDNPYDKLHGWYNVNLSVWLERPEDNLKIEFYAKNVLDKTPITDAFLNSDDTDLTTNVFVLDPRLIGLSIRKGF